MTLKEAAKAVGGICDSDGVFTSVSSDTRLCERDCLYIAIEGERFDGHDFVTQAYENGAVGAICRKPSEEKGIIYVEDTRKAQLALACYYKSKLDILTVGLTGSVGKTTTKEMIGCVLSQKYETLKTEGNLNNEIGLPKMIFRLNESYNAAVLEMGMNNPGEISKLSKCCRPDIGVITNIGVSHIENLGSQENILKAKMEILEGMDEKDPLFVNGDDIFLYEQSKKNTNPTVLFGIDNMECDYRAESIVYGEDFTEFTVSAKGMITKIRLPALGRHNVYNALCAFAVGAYLDIEPHIIAQALEGYVPAGMRQKIVRHKDITVIEDCYNASPDSIKAALNALALVSGRKKIAVLGDMLELGEYSQQAHYNCGAEAANAADTLYAYGNFAKNYCMGAQSKGLQNAKAFDNKDALLKALLSEICGNDVCLFKASRGMKLEEIIEKLYKEYR